MKKILITMKDKLVDIKIRAVYRDMIKSHCRDNGMKMYIFIEKLIEQNCNIKNKKKLLTSEYEN